MGIYFLESGAVQRPSKVIYDRAYSSISLASPGDIDWDKSLDGAAWMHVTGITPAISKGAMELALEGVKAAKRKGVQVSLDLNFRKNLWKYGMTAREVMPEFTRLADVIIANEEDVQKTLGISAETAGSVDEGKIDTSAYESIASRVLKEYPNVKVIAITLRESFSANHNNWSACLYDGKEFILSRKYQVYHQLGDVGHLLAGQALEVDDLVQTVQELRPECASKQLVGLLLRLVGKLSVLPYAAQYYVAAQVGGHDYDGVGKVHGMALAVGQPAVVQQLQQNVEQKSTSSRLMGFSPPK